MEVINKQVLKTERRNVIEETYGCINLLAIRENNTYKFLILASTLFAFYCTLIDFTLIIGKDLEITASSQMGIMKDFMYCLDFLFLIDFIASVFSLRKEKSHLRILVLIIYLLTLIPLEAAYYIMDGKNLLIYHGFRIRYILRMIVYYIKTYETKKRHFRIFPFLFKAIIAFSILNIIQSCTRLTYAYWVSLEQGSYLQNDTLNYNNLGYFEHIFSYSEVLGELFHVNFYYTGPKYLLLQHHSLIFQLIYFIFIYYLKAMLIIMHVESERTMFEFTSMCGLALNHVKTLRLRMSKDWNYTYDMFHGFFKKYLGNNWFRWEQNVMFKQPQKNSILTIPDVFVHEIFLNIAWNMFKHSLLFRNEPTHILRYIARLTQHKYLTESEIIFKTGQWYDKMVYIESGVVELLSDNGQIPIMDFRGGSCLGELNIFLFKPSKNTLVCRSKCIIVTIDRVGLLKIKKVFPTVYLEMKRRAMKRITQAKAYHEIGEMYSGLGKIVVKKENLSLRYIKKTLRKYLNIYHEDGNEILKQNIIQEDEILDKSVFCSDYLELYVIADDVAKETQKNVLKTGFNFKFHPKSKLITIWNVFVSVLATLLVISYPIAAESILHGKDKQLFIWFMILVSAIWILDFILVFFIALKTKNGFETDLFYICLKNTSTWMFWIDLVSSLPLDLILHWLQGPLSQEYLTFFQINRMLKIFKVLFVILQPGDTIKSVMFLHIFRSFCCFLTIMLIFYYIFDSINVYRQPLWSHLPHNIGVIYTFFFSAPIVKVAVNKGIKFWAIVILQYIIFIFKLIIVTKVVAIFSYFIITIVEFENMVDDIRKITTLCNFNTYIKRRIFRYLKIHYQKSGGLFLTRFNKLKLFQGYEICRFITTIEYFSLLKKLPLLNHLSDHFIKDMSLIGWPLLIPKHEILVQAGSMRESFYIIISGFCGIVTAQNALKEIKTVGEAVLILEVLSRAHVVNNIIALTECMLLVIPRNLFIRLLITHNEYLTFKNVLNEIVDVRKLAMMQEKEFNVKIDLYSQNKKSFNFFKADYIKKDFKDREWLTKFVFNFSIKAYGKFIIYWEFTYVCIVYLTAFFVTIPITSDNRIQSFWFWYFRLYEIISFVDMFFRSYVTYYDKNNIEIIHPKKTITHYLSTSFFIDFISSLPTELILFAHYERRSLYVTLSRVNRFLKLYRIGGCKRYFNEKSMKENVMLIIVICAVLTLTTFSLVTSILILPFCEISFASSTIMCHKNHHFWSFFFKHYKNCVKNVFNIGIVDENFSRRFIWEYILINFIGFLLITCITCVIIGLILNRNSDLIAFQIKMSRLVTYLKICKTDKVLCAEIIKHYEHLWSISEGKHLVETLSILNKSCYDDVLFSYFGDILKNSVLFENQPNVIIKDILSYKSLSRDIFLIQGVIIRVNDIQDKIYIIIKGAVNVFGPDFTNLRVLHEGSAFGCLDDIKNHRATLIYAAKTHCELLSMNAQAFHKIISRYPMYYGYYEYLLLNTNLDFIENTHTANKGIDKFSIISQKQNSKRRNLFRYLFFLFKIRQEKKWVPLLITIFSYLSFLCECFQKICITPHVYVLLILITFDILHLLKIHHHFFTSYENEYGLVEKRYKKIALRYIKTPLGFGFDLFCLFPFEIICPAFNKKYVGRVIFYTRLNRLFRITFVYLYINKVKNRLNINVFLIKSFRILTVYTTVSQISMIILSNFHLVPIENLTDMWIFVQIFTSEIFFTTNNIFFPWGHSENIYRYKLSYSVAFILIIILNRFLVIYLLGEFASAFQIFYNTQYRFDNFKGVLKKYIINKGVSKSLQQSVFSYLENCSNSKTSIQFPYFLMNAPFYLLEAVLNCTFGYHLRRHPVFKRCHVDLIRQMSACFVTNFFFPGDIIAFKGDIDSKMYFIHEGEVEGLSYDGMYSEEVQRYFNSDDCFGYKQLIYENVGHDYTYKVVKKTMVVFLDRELVIRLFDFFPASKRIIFNHDKMV